MRYKILMLVTLFVSMIVSINTWAEKPSDAELAKLLVGKWKLELQMGDVGVKGTSTYSEDGEVIYVGSILVNDREIKIDAVSTWKIESSVLITETIKSNLPKILPVGEINRDTIISLDENRFFYRDKDDSEFIELRL